MSEKISFRELVKSLSGRTDNSLAATERFVRELVDSIESGLRTDGEVSISGVGKFERRLIKERSGTHPQTKEKITIPAHYRVVFKPYKALREEVNKPYAHLEARPIDQVRKRVEGSAPQEAETPEHADGSESPDQKEQLWSGEVIIRERPAGKSPEPPFFVQLDEAVSDQGEPERLILERPSPVAEKSEGIPRKPGSRNRRKTNERIYWSILSIVGLITLLIWILYYIQTSDPSSAGNGSNTGNTSTPQPEVITEPSRRVSPEPEGTTEPTRPSSPEPETTTEPGVTTEPSSSTTSESDITSESSSPTSPEPDMEETEIIRILVKEGETLWSIAGERLDNSYLWPWIYQLNKQSIEQPNLILAGSDLYLPVTTGRDLNKKERKSVATGYLSLYRWHKEQQNAHAHHFLWAAGSFCPNLLDNIEQQVDHTDLKFARNR